MKSTVEIDAGVCGFNATIHAIVNDGQHVELEIDSQCQTIIDLADQLKKQPVINAIMELGPQESSVLKTARPMLVSKGCCEACIVPAGICKAIQVAAGLALPRDVLMKIVKED